MTKEELKYRLINSFILNADDLVKMIFEKELNFDERIIDISEVLMTSGTKYIIFVGAIPEKDLEAREFFSIELN